jgi:DNA-binding Xre family transcriptional regulator
MMPGRRPPAEAPGAGPRAEQEKAIMKWNLRLAAASRGIWKASELQKMLADRGMVISAGKMSGLWSGRPNAVKLADLDVICAVLGCEPGELLIPEPVPAARSADVPAGQAPAADAAPAVVPRRRDGRSLPPA